jgi:alpha-mannosidase
VVLYYEHTWGSWNSVSEPESPFTISQWEHKQAFAQSAALGSARLRRRTLLSHRWNAPQATHLDVINTLGWPRTDVIFLSPEESAAGDRVLDDAGRAVPSQRLSDGGLAFLAADVPAFGSRRYRLDGGPAPESRSQERRDNVIANSRFRLEIDTLTGAIASTFCVRLRCELVSGGAEGQLNRYLYVAGRDPQAAKGAGRPAIRVTERGPLVWAVETQAAAPGADRGIASEVRIYEGVPRIDITNRIDKLRVYTPEAVLYRFAFNIRDPQVRIDVPWGSFQPEQGQLPGASKNYMSLQRWVDVHDDQRGMTLASVDAPLVQIGDIRTDAIVSGWLQAIEPSAAIYSYVMNNYWETNYRAAQAGPHEFRYALGPHERFDEAQVERFAMGVAQPLIAVPVSAETPPVQPPLRFEAQRAVVTRLAADGDGLLVRIYNPGAQPTTATLWPPGAEQPLRYELEPYEIITVGYSVERSTPPPPR